MGINADVGEGLQYEQLFFGGGESTLPERALDADDVVAQFDQMFFHRLEWIHSQHEVCHVRKTLPAGANQLRNGTFTNVSYAARRDDEVRARQLFALFRSGFGLLQIDVYRTVDETRLSCVGERFVRDVQANEAGSLRLVACGDPRSRGAASSGP
jgi:hypothetical protein